MTQEPLTAAPAQRHDPDAAYYENQLESNREFWSRFGREPNFAGRTVLDIGCGHGAMSIAAASLGARVLGLDLDPHRIAWANENLRDNHPDLVDSVTFECRDIATLPPGDQFDILLSKDTMEHVDDVPSMCSEISRLMAPEGEFWAGFSPLYWSPNGDHGRTGLKVPWAHAVLPLPIVLASAQRHRQHHVAHLRDIGLNGMLPGEFRESIHTAGLEFRSLDYNRGEKRWMPTFSRLRRLTPLEGFFTIGIYAVIGHPRANR